MSTRIVVDLDIDLDGTPCDGCPDASDFLAWVHDEYGHLGPFLADALTDGLASGMVTALVNGTADAVPASKDSE